MAELNKDEVYEALWVPESIHYLSEQDCRDALSYLSGYSPDGMAEALAFTGRRRARRPDLGRDLPVRVAALREECTR